MIQVPRCKGCSTPLVITHDALGRERHRCPACEGVAPPPPMPDVRHSQAATSSDDMPWPRPDARKHVPRPRPVLSQASLSAFMAEAGARAARRTSCRVCEAPIEQPRTGRPREKCADVSACQARRRRLQGVR